MVHDTDRLRGVTLVEVVLMTAVFGVLAGMLMPAFSRAKSKNRRALCVNNLRQFSNALSLLRIDGKDRPPWLSCLYPTHVRDKAMFICPADASMGRDGCMPNGSPFKDVGAPQFAEADDTSENQAPQELRSIRNGEVVASSYLYDFNLAENSWWSGGSYPDANADGIVSWREVRQEVDMKGLQPDGTYSDKEAYKGHVPVVRCFHHVGKRFDGSATVLNLAVEDRNVYVSGPFKDDWKARLAKD